jgi:DNA invertase Pin-like site-specific DNA recombinase
MTRHENKIQEVHLCRRACVYVRQSTLAQVHEHQESTRRQYEMYQRACQLGWMDAQIEVIDEDLGHSAYRECWSDFQCGNIPVGSSG